VCVCVVKYNKLNMWDLRFSQLCCLPCSVVDSYKCSKESYCLYLIDRRDEWGDPAEGGNRLLQYIANSLPNYVIISKKTETLLNYKCHICLICILFCFGDLMRKVSVLMSFKLLFTIYVCLLFNPVAVVLCCYMLQAS